METLATKKYSLHPGDHYLSVVLRYDPENTYTPYITHLHNSTLAGGKGGYVEGHYFTNLVEAKEDFNSRGRI